MEFTFDEPSHAYRLNGVRLPSVTEILEYFAVSPQYPVGDYRVRGRNVHLATQYWDLGEEVEVGETIGPYLESYKLAMAGWDFEWSGIECRGYHEFLGYGFTADRVGRRKTTRKYVVADIKSGDTHEKETGLQTAGYVSGIKNCPHLRELLPCKAEEVECYRIRLYKDGKRGDVIQYRKPGAIEAFAGSVKLFHYLKQF